MGCCQSEHPSQNDFKSEIVTFEKREENSNIFEDQFYLDSVERYNVKYKPPVQKNPQYVVNGNITASGQHANNMNINGDSGASGGVLNMNQAVNKGKNQL